ncbi:p360 9L [African swine fever virus]|uniref:p360 9L n=1 Tax=African swine fever virus TaxID=10497 RepID=A0A894KSL6_ASF|nr:p360 9L [African swine fever virus]
MYIIKPMFNILFMCYGHVFCMLFFYHTFYIFGIGFFYRYRIIHAISIYCYNAGNVRFVFLQRYSLSFLNGIGAYVYTKEHVSDIIQLYTMQHGLFVISPYDNAAVLYRYILILLATGPLYHFIHVHTNLLLCVQLVQVAHVVVQKGVHVPPLVYMYIPLVQVLDGLCMVILYGYTVPILCYQLAQYIRIFHYCFQLFIYVSPYLGTIYCFYDGIMRKHLVAQNIVTAGYITFYYVTILYNFLLLYLFFTAYLSAQISSALRVVRKYTILDVRTPLGIQFYYVIFIFSHGFHQRRIIMHAICTNRRPYFFLVLFKYHGTIVPPYAISFYKMWVAFGRALSGYHFFGEGLQREDHVSFFCKN